MFSPQIVGHVRGDLPCKTINKTLNKHKVWRILSLISFTFGQSVYLKKQPKQIINSVENDHLVGGFNPFEK